MIPGVDVLAGLEQLEGAKLPTFYSPGGKQRATELAETAGNCAHYLELLYPKKVPAKLLVLNEKDWTKRVTYPYGLIAGSNNILWYSILGPENHVFKDMIPFHNNSPKSLQRKLEHLLPEQSSPYLYACHKWFEAVMVHEYAHNYNKVNNVDIKLSWFDELFCDYILYAYLKRYGETNPLDLQRFELFSEITFVGGLGIVKHRTIEDFERLYTDVGSANYCWYQGWFNLGAMNLYDQFGEDFIGKIIALYQAESGFDSTSEQLVSRLDIELEGFKDWYDEWIKQHP